jgi:hypothetical protein
MDLQLLRFDGNVMQVRGLQAPLAHRTVVVRLEPYRHALLAELVAADGQNTSDKGHLTNDAHSGLVGLGPGLFQVQHFLIRVSLHGLVSEKKKS